jgi:DtxR family Mn-dependent transcriptional regulator
MNVSLTEENYIKAIFSIGRGGAFPVSTTELSGRLMNKAGSVTEMLKRLSTKKLIRYRKYQGVKLTLTGQKLAVAVVRKHRLWEVFLNEKLGFRWDEVHDIAEQLEHIHSEELVRRLDHFLGKPRFDPHGEPIPGENGEIHENNAMPLSHAKKAVRYVFAGVTDDASRTLRHISSLGLKLGDRVRIMQMDSFDGSCQVQVNGRKLCFLGPSLCSQILVSRFR